MKVMYLTDQVFLHGGVEKVLSMKANWLAEYYGHEVTVVTTRQEGLCPVYNFNSKIRFLDLHVQYDIKKSYFHPENLRKIPHHYRALKKVASQVNPDIIIICNYAPDFYFLPFVKKNIPKIKEFHSSRFKSKSTTLKDRFLVALSTFAEKKYGAIAILNADEQSFYPSQNSVVIPNPTESCVRRATLHRKKVIAAGRLSPVKNFGELIDIWKIIAEAEPEWELHFYGEDYLGTKAMLEQKVQESRLDSVIKFKGVTEDMKKTMQDYSIYVMTSHSECFPMVLLEALSSGIPVVTYDAPTGPQHIVRDGEDSFLVEWGNQQEFAEKMLQLMQDQKLRDEMGLTAYQNSRRFSLKTVMTKWQNLFIYLTTHNTNKNA